MHERREHPRREVWFPIQIDTETKKERVGVSLDASANGLLLGTRSRLSVGHRLKLTLLPLSKRERPAVEAEVVWVAEADDAWPRRVAVRFDAPRPDLEQLFEHEVEQQPEWLRSLKSEAS